MEADGIFGLLQVSQQLAPPCAVIPCPIFSISPTALITPCLPSDSRAVNPCEGHEDLLEEGAGGLL